MKQSSILFFIMLSGVTAQACEFKVEFVNNTTHSIIMEIAFGSKLGQNKKQIEETHTRLQAEHSVKSGDKNCHLKE